MPWLDDQIHLQREKLFVAALDVHKAFVTVAAHKMEHNLGVLATGLENVRGLLGHSMRVDSGFRCTELNAAVGGAKTSAHMLGYAADFVCPGFGNPLEIVRAISASDLVFDQCIQEGTWVHISFDPKSRRDVLTAIFGVGGTSYRKGV